MRQDILYIGDSDLGSKSERRRSVICEKPSRRWVKKTLNLGALVIRGGNAGWPAPHLARKKRAGLAHLA